MYSVFAILPLRLLLRLPPRRSLIQIVISIQAVADDINEVAAEAGTQCAIVIYLLRKIDRDHESSGIERKPSHG